MIFLFRYGFDLIHGRTFPSLLDAWRLITGMVKYGGEPADYHALFRDPACEPYKLMFCLIGQFKARSREGGCKPVVLLHVNPKEITAHYSRRGNEVVAAGLQRFFKAQQLMP